MPALADLFKTCYLTGGSGVEFSAIRLHYRGVDDICHAFGATALTVGTTSTSAGRRSRRTRPRAFGCWHTRSRTWYSSTAGLPPPDRPRSARQTRPRTPCSAAAASISARPDSRSRRPAPIGAWSSGTWPGSTACSATWTPRGSARSTWTLAASLLHGYFNKRSLLVAAGPHGTPFRIHGDRTLLAGGDGTQHAAKATAASRRSVAELLAHGETSISCQEIFDSLPDHVEQEGTLVALCQWHDSSLRDLCFSDLFSLWRTSATKILASAVCRRFGVPSPDIEALRNG